MENKKNVYVSLAILTLFGLMMVGYFCPERATLANFISFFYIFHLAIFYRQGVDDVEEKPLYGISCWIAALTTIICVLSDVDFMVWPLCSCTAVVMYFILGAYIWNRKISYTDLFKNTFWILVVIYTVDVLISVLL